MVTFVDPLIYYFGLHFVISLVPCRGVAISNLAFTMGPAAFLAILQRQYIILLACKNGTDGRLL